MEKKEWSPDELKHKAEAYCAAAERCEYDVRLKLKQWNADTKTADEIVDFLYNHDFLNVQRYCNAFVHDKLLFQGWGRIKIEYMLRARHLPSGAIQSALKAMDEAEYFNVLTRLVETKSFNTLLQRGFTTDEIKKCGGFLS